ncbi:MAG: MFS transporter [Betaproteobacteria bacterium]|nr:MFS transporter [Betaproteobacteria bacterium]
MSDPHPRHAANAPAMYLAVLQFVFLSTWTVYAIYLPELLQSVGVARSWTAWLLLADQVLFAVCDVLAGFAADRAFRLYGRVGTWVVGATVASCLAFLLLPWLAGTGGGAWRAPVFLALTAVWAITSSALRAPVFAMLSRHVPPPQVPAVAGLALAGMALAGAVAPYLGVTLKGLDPRLPFAVSSLALLALAAGLVRAERALRATPSPQGEALAASAAAPGLVFPVIAVAALAFQILFGINAAPRYLRDAAPAALPWLMPVFWIGFNVAVFSVGPLARRLGSARAFAAACLVGAVGATAGAWLPGLAAATAGQMLAGLGWGAALAAAFGLSADCARAAKPGREATMTGLLFAMLALATLVRIATAALGLPQQAHWATILVALPILAWMAAGLASRSWRSTSAPARST